MSKDTSNETSVSLQKLSNCVDNCVNCVYPSFARKIMLRWNVGR